ncbi:hypothetical protein CANARDRAFT_7815 [[Candida] arabinofermentans NRRL YB-2248]|uniref:Protein-lysine N-methyltransferase EFM4 n=1 Tax=[Candida] arabinofermentans NRRL YB-2248 TaxID=983967 RepID=A0A1E4T074_9ASCO|nr:hypothetical protein CANARDRAFT_7815 [[Candida] arabinofermentans NRRL YB-2248]
MSGDETTIKLNPSKLGTKKYWDDFYEVEHSNFEENQDDTGECWFSDADAEDKIIEFLFSNFNQIESLNPEAKICDLGTGNGHLLFTILEEGWKGELVGVDYSEASIKFAKDIADANDLDVMFEQSDILDFKDEFLVKNTEEFDLVLDKGTLDAIGLSDSKYGDNGELSAVDMYPQTVKNLVKKGGLLIVTSCNFTEEELSILILKYGDFKVWKKIDYPVFEFGGVKGSAICSIAFMRL